MGTIISIKLVTLIVLIALLVISIIFIINSVRYEAKMEFENRLNKMLNENLLKYVKSINKLEEFQEYLIANSQIKMKITKRGQEE